MSEDFLGEGEPVTLYIGYKEGADGGVAIGWDNYTEVIKACAEQNSFELPANWKSAIEYVGSLGDLNNPVIQGVRAKIAEAILGPCIVTMFPEGTHTATKMEKEILSLNVSQIVKDSLIEKFKKMGGLTKRDPKN